MKTVRRKSAITSINAVDEFRRVNGMQQLLTFMPEKPLPGISYHVLSGGHIDLLSHLLWVLQLYGNVRYVFLSCWAISAPDIYMVGERMKEGVLGNIDLLLGDIFSKKYRMEWQKLMEYYDNGWIKNIYTSTIHSKVMLIDIDDSTKIVIESSANCNMNPRIEQSCITLNSELYAFYHSYFMEVLEDEEARFIARDIAKHLNNEDYNITGPSLFGENDFCDEMGG